VTDLLGPMACCPPLGHGEVGDADETVGLVSASHPFEVLADADITPEAEQAGEEDDDEPAPEPSLGIHIERDNRTR
jgi:hypothetical protein